MSQLQTLRTPVMGVCRNPILGLRPDQMHEVAVGGTLQTLAPKPQGLLVCRHNGQYVVPEDWERSKVGWNDTIEFYDFPQDREALSFALRAAVAIAAFYFSGGNPLVFAAINIGGNLAINALLPLNPAQVTAPTATTTYSTSLEGNQARLDDPIWKICGRCKVVPPFAGQPYLEYRDTDGNNLDNDQYYYAVYIVGIGNHNIENAFIGQTKITHFQDVLKAVYLPPGTLPTLAKANVYTSREVSSQVMDTALYVGGYSACQPGRKVAQIGIDVSATRGLGDGGNLTVQWRVEAREIDDFGSAVGPWSILAVESRTANTNTPQRWTSTYTITTAKRFEVRVVRLDSKNTGSNALHEIAWVGLRGYLADAAPLNANAAHYEVVMRASEQLSAEASRQISLVTKGMCRTWAPIGGWLPEVETRNAAWWALDLATNPVWGLGLPDSRIDLQSFYDLAQVWDARQDRFDYVFDSTVDGWEAMQTIVRTGRARVFRRHGLLTVARDEQADLPMTAFTPGNAQDMEIAESLPVLNTPDGFIVEYFSNRTWQWTPIECPCPGVTEMEKPVHLRLPGITGSKHAEREGLFEAAALAYRTRTASCVTEMQGMLPAYLSPVRFMQALGYGQSGEVVAWDEGTLTATLSEPPIFTESNYLTLMRDDGSLTLPVAVFPGPTANDVVLPVAPDFTLVTDDGGRDRPRFLFGAQGTSDELCKVAAISDGGLSDDGAQLYELAFVVDDDRVHAADNALLPGPGEIQDPVGSADGISTDPDTGGGAAAIVNMRGHTVYGGDYTLAAGDRYHTSDGAPVRVNLTLTTTGTANWLRESAGNGTQSGTYPNEWLSLPSDPSICALYEVRLTGSYAHSDLGGMFLGDAVETWLPFSQDRYWELNDAALSGSAEFWPPPEMFLIATLEFRLIGSPITQAIADLTFVLYYYTESGGD